MRINLSPSFFHLADGENHFLSGRMNAFLSYKLGKWTLGASANAGVSNWYLPSGSATALSLQTGGAVQYRITDRYSVGAGADISIPSGTVSCAAYAAWNF